MLSIALRPLAPSLWTFIKNMSNRDEVKDSTNNASYFSVMPVDDTSADWVAALGLRLCRLGSSSLKSKL